MHKEFTDVYDALEELEKGKVPKDNHLLRNYTYCRIKSAPICKKKIETNKLENSLLHFQLINSNSFPTKCFVTVEYQHCTEPTFPD